jgi:hypothetical protein
LKIICRGDRQEVREGVQDEGGRVVRAAGAATKTHRYAYASPCRAKAQRGQRQVQLHVKSGARW